MRISDWSSDVGSSDLRGQLALTGENVAAALETRVPGDISALKPGRMRYSLLLGEDGGILDDLMITNSGHSFYLVVNGAVKWDDIAHLRDNMPDENTLNHIDDHGLLALQGPQAVDARHRMGLTPLQPGWPTVGERKSTRLNSS